MEPGLIDSASVGEPTRFRDLAELEEALQALPGAPADGGTIALLVRRLDGGRRETLDRVALAPDLGVPGDAWGRRPQRNPEMQLAVMQLDVAELIANGQPLTLFGDNLFVDLDLSTRNLPAGSRLRAGGVTFEVTPAPHNGCRKFRARFGDGALGLVSKQELRDRNLRGIYLRVLEGGTLACGDRIAVLTRALAPPAA